MSPLSGLDPNSLSGRIAALDEQGALDAVTERVTREDDPLSIIEECQLGMRYVGEHYSSGKYFISGLIMAGEIFREAMLILSPLLQDAPAESDVGCIVLCTVRGDIHDLGKSIVAMMLRSYGFDVHDLGVDVAPDEVARQVRHLKPDIVGLSGLLSIATTGMKETVELLHDVSRELGRDVPVIIGGGIVDEQLCRHTGADLWSNDAAEGVRLIRRAVAERRS